MDESKTQFRLKGGIAHCDDGLWHAIVHIWPEGDTTKEPVAYTGNESFEDEEEAMKYYRETVRPMLYKIMTDTSKKLNLSVAFTPLDN